MNCCSTKRHWSIRGTGIKRDHISGLSWFLPPETQSETIEDVLSTKDFNWGSLILPDGRKDCWQNCAEILSRLPDRVIAPLAPRMLEWVQDVNWPGAFTIVERLRKLPPEMLTPGLDTARKSALEKMDAIWLEYLNEYFGAANQKHAGRLP